MKRTLILDDDPVALRLMAGALQRYGLEVIACREPEAAETAMAHEEIEAVVTDLCVSPLGGLGGVRLIGSLAAHYPGRRIVAVSAYVTETIADLCRRMGACAVLPKPVDLKELARAVTGQPEPFPTGGGAVLEVEALESFLETGSLWTALQPIVALDRDGPPFRLLGVEALCRSSGMSLLKDPAFLFAYAARKDRLYETDLLSVRSAFAEARGLNGGGLLFLNIHPHSLSNPRLAGRVEALAREVGFDPASVVIELTERQTILNPAAFGATVAELRDLGFRIALDDYGEGFANLQWLVDLRPDFLKISGYLALNLEGDRFRRAIVSSTARMAEELGIPTILEWVEDAGQLAAARQIGIRYGQGYYIARPSPAEDLVRSNRFADLAPAPAGT